MREALAGAGQAGAAHGVVAELLVSELATNAIRYGGGEDFRLDVDVDPDGVRVAVHDHNPELPTPRQAGLEDEGGRGVHLVATVATAWGCEGTGDGKVVWFSLRAAAAGESRWG